MDNTDITWLERFYSDHVLQFGISASCEWYYQDKSGSISPFSNDTTEVSLLPLLGEQCSGSFAQFQELVLSRLASH